MCYFWISNFQDYFVPVNQILQWVFWDTGAFTEIYDANMETSINM